MSQSSRIEYSVQWAPYQKETVNALESGAYDLVVLRTGYGGGKSITGSQWIHRGGLQLTHGESLVMAQDFQKGESTTFKVFFETLPGGNTVPNDADGDPENSPIVAGYNDNKKRLTYISGHVVRLGSADVWNRFAGGEFNRIWCDEVSHYENTNLYDLHEMLISRQRTDEGPNTTLWTSTGNGYNQFYDVTERHVDEDDDPLPWSDSMKVIVASMLDNPFLTDAAKEKMRRQFEGTAREEQGLHGGFAAAKGLVYDSFSRDRHVVPEAEADELVDDSREPIYGYDHGWDDPRVVLDIRRTAYDQLLVYDAFYRSESKVREAVDWLKAHPTGTIYCEHEPEHQEEFKAAGFNAKPAIKDLDEGIPAVRERLELDSEERPGLLVSDRCTDLIQEFMSYKEDYVGKSKAVDHALDSLRYAIMGDTHAPEQGDLWVINS